MRVDVRAMVLLMLSGCAVRAGGEATTMGSGGGGPGPGGGGGGMIEAGCSYDGTELPGDIGSEFQVMCPANCANEGSTYGSDLYTLDSSICRTGIHAGAISDGGGAVEVRIEPGRPAYRGSARNGIRSSDYGEYPKSYVVLNGGAGGGPGGGPGGGGPGGGGPQGGPPDDGGDLIEVGCSYDGTQIVGDIGTRVMVSCPANCAGQGATWGTDLYTLDSGVCRAAIHAGVITDAGGEAVVTIEPGRRAFRGSSRHGIESSDYGNYPKSFRVDRP